MNGEQRHGKLTRKRFLTSPCSRLQCVQHFVCSTLKARKVRAAMGIGGSSSTLHSDRTLSLLALGITVFKKRTEVATIHFVTTSIFRPNPFLQRFKGVICQRLIRFDRFFHLISETNQYDLFVVNFDFELVVVLIGRSGEIEHLPG